MGGGEYDSFKQGKRKKGRNKGNKENAGFDTDQYSTKAFTGRTYGDQTEKSRKSFNKSGALETASSIVRKQVDPETVTYFSEIANLLEGGAIELEERSVICANALEEARGKEFELATDYIISHTLQTLLEGCDVDHLCGFLRSCAKNFPFIAMDRAGSHVAETAIKTLSMHLQDEQSDNVIEEALTIISKVIASKSIDVMCNCYGSHVLRTLLCICKGVGSDDPEYNVTKSATVLAQRSNFKLETSKRDDTMLTKRGFPNLLNFLMSEMLKHAREEIKDVQIDHYGSLVLQTALKLIAGDEESLCKAIPIILGCKEENILQGNLMPISVAQEVVGLLKETSFSHLMEVILEVAPEPLYLELFTKIFTNSLLELSSHQCGNFVVQALISHARNPYQMESIWKELGPNIKDLLDMGRSGVVAALIAACQRLHVHENKSCQTLAMAVCPEDEFPKCIVPHLLFLDSYINCEDKSKWSWISGTKMHVIGSLILQTVFRFQNEHIQPYINSITSMEADHALETAKDTSGARVIEAFLSSGATTKQKRRLIRKLQGYYGELSLHSSGSFTIEKCFTASNLSLREAIVSELLAARGDLSKTKQGPYLLRKLDVDSFAARPDHWRSKQESKQSTYKEFQSVFGSDDVKSTKSNNFLAATSKTESEKSKSNPTKLKEVRKEIYDGIASAATFLSTSGFQRKQKKDKHKCEKIAEIASSGDVSDGKKWKKQKR